LPLPYSQWSMAVAVFVDGDSNGDGRRGQGRMRVQGREHKGGSRAVSATRARAMVRAARERVARAARAARAAREARVRAVRVRVTRAARAVRAARAARAARAKRARGPGPGRTRDKGTTKDKCILSAPCQAIWLCYYATGSYE
jgi:hypothetical protein